LKTKPQRYHCPHCNWDFSFRKKRCCPGCGTFLLIGSDPYSDAELTALRSFWLWEPLKEEWIYVQNWEEHKREAMQKFEEFAKSPGSGQNLATETRRPLKNWIH
jgi:hypothetical protein